MSIFMGALGGLGEAAQQIGMQRQKVYDEETLMNERAALEEKKALAIENYKRKVANEPLERFGLIAKARANEQVPLEAAPVKSLTGGGVDVKAPDGSSLPGLQGAAADIWAQAQAQAKTLKPQEAQEFLSGVKSQLQQQYNFDSKTNEDAVAGKMRNRTADEATNAARDWAMVNDPVAFAAYEEKIGKPAREERRIDTLEKREDTRAAAIEAGERFKLAAEDRKDARQREAEDRRDARQLQALLAAEARAETRANGGKPPAGYRLKADGSNDLEFIPGGPADPEMKNKPLPGSAAKGLLDNADNLRRAERAWALVNGETVDGIKGDKEATGKKGWLPNQVLNRVDAEGADTRAAIADLGSMVIHERSGAAVSASEFPRLAPFVPNEKDDAQTVKKKLDLFVKNYRAIIEDQTNFYRESGYKVPTQVLKVGESPATGGSSPKGGWSIKEVK